MFWIIFFMLEREEGVFTPDHVGIRSNPKVCYLYPSYGLFFQTETPEEKSSGLNPSPMVHPAWGSRSTSKTLLPLSARAADKFIAVVVFPTPPLLLAMAINLLIATPPLTI